MKNLIALWQAAHQKLWKFAGETPRMAMIITNGASDEVQAGTPIFASIGTGGPITVTMDGGVEFVIDFDLRRITAPKGGGLIQPMTKAQVGYWNVDFGAQFTS